MSANCCEDLETKLTEVQHQIKDMQRRIEAAISQAQQTIDADAKLRAAGGISRGQWSYSKGSAEASQGILKALGGQGSRTSIRRRSGLARFLKGVIRL